MSEVTGSEWRQVDFQAGEVRLDPGTTKNDEGRVFPFTVGAARASWRGSTRSTTSSTSRARSCRGSSGEMRGKRGSRTGRRASQTAAAPIGDFGKTWHRGVPRRRLSGRIPHDFRRTAVRNLVRAGIPERVAMQMTGHKTRSVFERYNIVSPGDLREAARKLDERQSRAQFRAQRREIGRRGRVRVRRKLLKRLERETGIEPATSSLGSSRSTAELLPL